MQRQLAIKIVAISIIGLILLVPINMVKFKVYERQNFLEHAKASIARSRTAPQTLVTPLLVVPFYTTPSSSTGFYTAEQTQPPRQYRFLQPDSLQGNIQVKNENLYKGIYEIPVYKSDINLTGKFSQQKLDQTITDIKNTPRFQSHDQPFIMLHVSDVRGISKTPLLQVNGTPLVVNPGSQIDKLAAGLHAKLSAATNDSDFINFTFDMALDGMGSFSFVQLADEAKLNLQSNWPHPEFMGNTLPSERTISNTGFSAEWVTTRYSSNNKAIIERCLTEGNCSSLFGLSSGVRFIEPVDVYLQTERSLKYAILFIGLSFITFFIFEHLKNIRIHPIQYAFVGLALSVFYLLLISLAEHIAFHWAYLIAMFSCSGLLLFYLKHLLQSFKSALLFSAMLTTLHASLYVIVQAEDFALLMGSVLVFMVLTLLMFVTRKIDWYQLTPSNSEPPNTTTN